MKRTIDCYEIKATIIIRKDLAKKDGLIKASEFKDRIEQGIEVPCEEVNVQVND